MEPPKDVSGVPYDFNKLPMWLYPDVWDETKHVRLRGLWFVLLYTLSGILFFGLVAFVLALISPKPLALMLWFSLIFSVPIGSIMGLAAWWDFTRRHKKLLAEKNSAASHKL